MHKHPLRKFFGLTVLYAAVIVGIFVLQFKTQSIISKTIGNFKVTLYQVENENQELILKNEFSVTHNGISLFSNEKNPAYAVSSDGNKTNLELEQWTETENQAVLLFSGDLSLTFDSSAEEEKFSVYADFPDSVKEIYVPYELKGQINQEATGGNKIILSMQNENFTFTVPSYDEKNLVFTKKDAVAQVFPYTAVQKFEFSSVAELPLASEDAFNSSVKALRGNALVKTKAEILNPQNESYSEKEVAVYVAEMGASGKYNEAIQNVPDSFKQGTKRTYLTTPYFNHLVEMNKTLNVQTENFSSMTDKAVSSKNADIFTVEGISDYILREKKSAKIRNLLAITSASDFYPDLNQAAGILYVYADLYARDKDTAALLGKVLPRCADVIENNCTLKGEELFVEGLDLAQTVAAGFGLGKAGSFLNNANWKNAGFLIVNSALKKQETFNSKTLASLYPLLVKNNSYYPHTEILGYYGTQPVWAWTCAQNVTYEIDSESVVNINIDFPVTQIHHVIFNGIPTFHSQIEIQGLMFKTDPRFESYNSSGYVYLSDQKTLLLKSRHKSAKELVRLFCDPAANFTR